MASCDPTAWTGSVLAVLRAADGVSLVLLVVFTWWGVRKGALRQALSLVVLGGAFACAAAFGHELEPSVESLFELAPAERAALAWGAVLFGALVAGGLLLRLLAQRLPGRSRGGGDRVFGGLFGAAKGALVLTLVGYAVLAFGSEAPGPQLSRPTAPAAPAATAGGLDARVRGSLSALCLRAWSDLLRGWIALPRWVDERVEDVNRRIDDRAGAGHEARPSPR